VATPIANGFRFEPAPGTPPSTFEAFLANNLIVEAAPDSDRDFDVAVAIATTEANPTGGEVSVPQATTNITIPVTVTPVVDTPALGGSSSGNEDGTVAFGGDISIATADATDGSQAISQVTIGNLPAGLVPSFTSVGTTTVTTVGGIYIISGDEADILATLATFSLDLSDPAYADNADDFALDINVTTTDTDDVTGIAVTETVGYAHPIIVNAVADLPTVAGDIDEVTPEDTAVRLDDLAAALSDVDGSETLTVEIRGVDPDAVIQSGAGVAYPSTVQT
ncbi:MAG: hypothetical protein AAFR70_15525, partial [Pseudomonadota bacterium]